MLINVFNHIQKSKWKNLQQLTHEILYVEAEYRGLFHHAVDNTHPNRFVYMFSYIYDECIRSHLQTRMAYIWFTDSEITIQSHCYKAVWEVYKELSWVVSNHLEVRIHTEQTKSDLELEIVFVEYFTSTNVPPNHWITYIV